MSIDSSSIRVASSSLDWALKHVERFGDTDIFPLPFEYAAIRHSWEKSREYLEKQDLLQWTVRPHRRCLSPKHRYGFRIATQLDPFDHLLYTALVYELGNDIERARLPASAHAVHSYRFKPDGNGEFFSKDFSFESFRVQSDRLANEDGCQYVVVADVADFYPRIYSHPLDNALVECATQSAKAKALSKLLKQWNSFISYGIPVGPAASRLLGELVLSDVDAALKSESILFCRYVDDFHLFARDERTAYESLAVLAKVLFDHHGLTLQQHKTNIWPVVQFNNINRRTERDQERRSLTQRFEDILTDIGIEDWYHPIEYEDLEEDVQRSIDKLNLVELLNEQIKGESDPDPVITKFVLRRLSQLGSAEALDVVLEAATIVRLYPLFKDVMEYLRAVRHISIERRHEIGETLLGWLDDSIVGHLEFHRCWVLNTFTHDQDWNNEEKVANFLQRYPDPFTRREVISAMGRAHQIHWFKTNKKDYQQFGPWEKRAFIAAASCLPGDEGKFWYQAIKGQLDELDKVVVDWARKFPY